MKDGSNSKVSSASWINEDVQRPCDLAVNCFQRLNKVSILEITVV